MLLLKKKIKNIIINGSSGKDLKGTGTGVNQIFNFVNN